MNASRSLASAFGARAPRAALAPGRTRIPQR